MKKNWLKWALCLVLAVGLLACAASAAIAQEDVAADTGTTITVTDGKLTVAAPGTADKQYVLIQVKTTLTADSAEALLTAAKAASTAPYELSEDAILYIDQDAAAAGGTVTFSGFQPKAAATSLFVLGGDAEPKIIGAMITHGVTVSGTVTAKEGANGAASVTVTAGDVTETVTLTNGTGTYTLSGVPAEVTTLTVATGDNKFVTREYAIDASADVAQDVVLWAKGDVVGNGNGVMINDVAALFSHQTKVTTITDAYALKVGDVVGNGNGIMINDVAAVFAHQTKVTPLW